jgi:hypothetical protein
MGYNIQFFATMYSTFMINNSSQTYDRSWDFNTTASGNYLVRNIDNFIVTILFMQYSILISYYQIILSDSYTGSEVYLIWQN